MFLNQLVNDGESAYIEPFLRHAIVPPESEAAAQAVMDELDAHVDALREQGSSAQHGRVAPLLSWFWWSAAADAWPVLWASIWTAFNRMGFGLQRTTSWEVYRDYREHVVRFGPFEEVEALSLTLEGTGDYGIDITTCDRLAIVATTNTPDAGPEAFAECQRTLELLREMGKAFGKEGESALRQVFHSEIEFRQPSIWWDSKNNVLRANLYLTWTPERGVPSPSMMLLADGQQVQIGMHGSSMRNGFKGLSRRTFDLLEHDHPDGVEWMIMAGHQLPDNRSLSELPASAVLGRRFSIADLDDHGAAVAHLTSMAKVLMPAFEAVWAAETAGETPPVRARASAGGSGTSLESLKAQFLAKTGYPDESDLRHQRTQKEWERLLARESLASAPLTELRRIYNGSAYGAPGPQSILNTTLSDEEPEVVDRFRAAIEHVLWGDGTAEQRIDRVMDERQLGLRGFKEGAIMKFLAVARPDEFLAVYPFTGSMGKAALLRALRLDVPPMSASVGQRQFSSNNALRLVVAPLFPGDAWAQSRFLYWLLARSEDTGLEVDELTPETDEDRLGAVASDLLMPRSFLDEVHGLLSKHRQVIFYGPPGTGKTFVAQRLAEALAPSDDARMLVQFHPSTSYEDFFEGYRPLSTGDDQMVYKLVSGPLRIMAERAAVGHRGASAHPDHRRDQPRQPREGARRTPLPPGVPRSRRSTRCTVRARPSASQATS